MGIHHGMSFESFLDILIDTTIHRYDVHVLPQSHLLCIGKQMIPKFVGRVEQIHEHWSILRDILQQQGIEVMQSLPQKNVRRIEKTGLQKYFCNDAVIDKTLQIYGDDVTLFYNDISIDNLIGNAPLPQITPLQSRSLKLSSWLRNNVFKT